jgi:hypothetical protein
VDCREDVRKGFAQHRSLDEKGAMVPALAGMEAVWLRKLVALAGSRVPAVASLVVPFFFALPVRGCYGEHLWCVCKWVFQ